MSISHGVVNVQDHLRCRIISTSHVYMSLVIFIQHQLHAIFPYFSWFSLYTHRRRWLNGVVFFFSFFFVCMGLPYSHRHSPIGTPAPQLTFPPSNTRDLPMLDPCLSSTPQLSNPRKHSVVWVIQLWSSPPSVDFWYHRTAITDCCTVFLHFQVRRLSFSLFYSLAFCLAPCSRLSCL